MAAISERRRATNESIRLVTTLVRREIWDTLRDWRMVVPIIVLTLFFPALMSWVANYALRGVARYGAEIVGERMIPFLLLVVGFFPISFSLVIALETFVGEKERRSLEPLLATPLSDTQLYLGKTLAAMIPPLLAAYLGITVYLAGLYFIEGWTPSPILLVLTIVLTTAKGLVMVTGAVVVSSQTTSVRAANLLASFIIIPMALLVQGEALIMFWANYSVLWWIVLLLLVTDVVLIRMGVHTFNREELLGRDIDELNLASMWRSFRARLRWELWFFGVDVPKMPPWLRWLGALGGLYRLDIPAILRRSRWALLTVFVALLFSAYVGYAFAERYQLPLDVLQREVSSETFTRSQNLGLFTFTTWDVFVHNLRVLAAAALLAVFSFGTLAIALLMLPMAVIFFLVVQAASVYNPIVFFSAAVLPHGVLELPAAIIATALSVRLGAVFMSPPKGMTVGEGWLWALADFVKVFLALVVPLLVLAALLEVHVTPLVVLRVLGG
ncbi:MAG: stage II sporulation protein M [Anaerolineae bacterium]|nr:stage II sporulation protein M [Anaerolineae bacterium]